MWSPSRGSTPDIDRQSDAVQLDELAETLTGVLADTCVRLFSIIGRRCRPRRKDHRADAGPPIPESIRPRKRAAADFLTWLVAGNFTPSSDIGAMTSWPTAGRVSVGGGRWQRPHGHPCGAAMRQVRPLRRPARVRVSRARAPGATSRLCSPRRTHDRRCTPTPTRLRSGSSCSTTAAAWIGEDRSLAQHTAGAYNQRASGHSCAERQGRHRVATRSGFAADSRQRQDLLQFLETANRATSFSKPRLTSSSTTPRWGSCVCAGAPQDPPVLAAGPV
jgi:hypothetical protein